MKILTSLLPIALLASTSLAATGDWAQFRGPGGLGIGEARGLPTEWSSTKNVAWKAKLPGPGASCPVVFGNRIFLTCYSGFAEDPKDAGDPGDLKYHLVCIDRDSGRILWEKSIKSDGPVPAYTGQMPLHGYASSTPAVDADAIYTFFGTTGVVAWKHDGSKLWTTKVGDGTHNWGSSNSPLLFENLVIVNASVESKSLIALDRKTGKEVWRQGGMEMSWNSPLLVPVGGKHELVVSVKSRLKAFDPSNGKPIWDCAGIEDYVCPSVVTHDGVVFAIGARKCAAVAVRVGGSGDVTDSHTVWRLDRGSNVSSPVYYQDHLYWADEKGKKVFCADAKTGKLVYEEDLPAVQDASAKGEGSRIYASPVVADGNLFYINRSGNAFVVKADPSFKLVAQNRFDGDKSRFNASPIVHKNQLLIRSDETLYCLGKR